jgi:hypothetical protein
MSLNKPHTWNIEEKMKENRKVHRKFNIINEALFSGP